MKTRTGRGVLLTAVVAVAAVLVAPVSVSSPEPATAEVQTAAPTGFVHLEDVVYGAARDHRGRRQRLRMDLWVPTGDQTRRPAIVLAHGGGFRRGHRKQFRIRQLARSLAEAGFVTASASYRLRPKNRIHAPTRMALVRSDAARDAQHDLQAAVRFLRHRAGTYGVDRRRIALLGASAGGIAALRAAHLPHDPGRSGHRRYRSNVQAVISLWGADDRRHIGRGTPPTLMFHGAKDRLVPFWAARQTCSTTRRRGGVCVRRWWWGEGHAPWHRTPQVTRITVRFLTDRLS